MCHAVGRKPQTWVIDATIYSQYRASSTYVYMYARCVNDLSRRCVFFYIHIITSVNRHQRIRACNFSIYSFKCVSVSPRNKFVSLEFRQDSQVSLPFPFVIYFKRWKSKKAGLTDRCMHNCVLVYACLFVRVDKLARLGARNTNLRFITLYLPIFQSTY